ncbi:uncharacterized protein LOC123723348 [Papilio machaon]|uniref:uncharacterized protein LOC123723348 n=1 Tax=Papilio machaon TaxID=76193 RepID=UPI001E66375D|nr:uncharacterized protein LOC123723348 [Papilio machaon]
MVHRASTINNENTVHSFNTFGANEVQQIIATSAQRPPESNFRHQDKGSTVWTGEDKVEIEVCSDKPEDEYEERSKFEERYYALMAQARNLLCRDGAADDGRSVAGSICKQAAMVKVIDDNGNSMDARLLLDNGSTANFITQSLCSKLKLSTRSVSSEINGINNQSLTSTQACNLTIESQCCRYKANIECYILPEITKILPSTIIDISQLSLPSDLHLADPSFNIPSVIDILVGAEVFWDVICTKSINLGKNKPKLVESKLGWIVTGQLPIQTTSNFTHSCNLSIRDLDNNLKRFWELDSVASSHALSSEERACEESFNLNTIRDEDGRFIVTIPLKNNTNVLGESYEMAQRRFLSLERRFQRNPVFKERYIAFMQEYERLGHMTENNTRNTSEAESNIEYFLPHHGVINDASTTTKFRVVFDASAPTSSGLSFNDIQMVGPTIQDDLLSILLRFRQHKYVISADIEKMYRAINVTPNQRSLQQIIFRENNKLPLKTYKLNTVTYGTASAPYLATKCLSSLASSASNEQTKRSILQDFYVDDYLSGGDTIPQVVQLNASEKVYGSCVYVRSIDEQNQVKVRLLISKNRVAPIKPTTIPRQAGFPRQGRPDGQGSGRKGKKPADNSGGIEKHRFLHLSSEHTVPEPQPPQVSRKADWN